MLALVVQAPAQSSQAPTPSATTPGACRKEVTDYVTKKRAELPPLPATGADAVTLQAVNQQRLTMSRQISADQIAMSQACAAKFTIAGTADVDLADLAQLYLDTTLGQTDTAKVTATIAQAKEAMTRAVALTNQPPAARATTLAAAVTVFLREQPPTPERNARLERVMDELDKLPEASLTQKVNAHLALENYYRYDDIDAGIIKHAKWLIETVKVCDVADRKTIAPRVVGAYINMAEAWAGQGMNDEAIDLLRRAPQELSDVPNAPLMVQPEIERLQLVGTQGAPITAPRWLNMPEGKTSVDLKGKVTLLEFSAHWCVPCKESYPGVNRLRAKYGPQGFQVVIATQLYGYFQTERPLGADAEFDRDRTYFAEHGLDVPIAIGDQVTAKVVEGKVTYVPAKNPNDVAYRVGGIPQIHLIDKQGRIRLVMVGYDDLNEPKLSKMIEEMLNEK
jgi:thiol-disulfide isomerase/thioredoxin